MPKIKVNHTQLYYEIHGNGQPLVLINGIIADHHAWDFILKELSLHRQVIIFDNRGTGKSDSPTPGYSIKDMANDVIALLDRLGLEKADILGHSMGGCIAQYIACHCPEKIQKCIISDSFIKLNAAFRIFARTRIQLYKLKAPRLLFAESIIPWAYGPDYLSQAGVFDKLLAAHLHNPNFQTEEGYQGQYEAMVGFDSSQWIHNIRVPVLVTVGADDIVSFVSESKEIAEHIPNAQFVVIPKAGHNPESEQPELYLQHILSFL